MTEAVIEEKRAVVITDDRMKEAEYFRTDWVVNAAEGTTIADILEPLYWMHQASRMNQFDRIDVREETGAWLAELIVLHAERTMAIVKLLHKYDLESAEAAAQVSQAYAVKWAGPHRKFRVVRVSDGTIVQDGLFDKQAANDWISQFERAVRQ